MAGPSRKCNHETVFDDRAHGAGTQRVRRGRNAPRHADNRWALGATALQRALLATSKSNPVAWPHTCAKRNGIARMLREYGDVRTDSGELRRPNANALGSDEKIVDCRATSGREVRCGRCSATIIPRSSYVIRSCDEINS